MAANHWKDWITTPLEIEHAPSYSATSDTPTPSSTTSLVYTRCISTVFLSRLYQLSTAHTRNHPTSHTHVTMVLWIMDGCHIQYLTTTISNCTFTDSSVMLLFKCLKGWTRLVASFDFFTINDVYCSCKLHVFRFVSQVIFLFLFVKLNITNVPQGDYDLYSNTTSSVLRLAI